MKQIKTTHIILAVLLLSLCVGCATLFPPPESITWTVNSVPVSGADVIIDGKIMGQTPLTVNYTNKAGTTYSISKEGFISSPSTQAVVWGWSTYRNQKWVGYMKKPGQEFATLGYKKPSGMKTTVTVSCNGVDISRGCLIPGFKHYVSFFAKKKGDQFDQTMQGSLSFVPKSGKHYVVQARGGKLCIDEK